MCSCRKNVSNNFKNYNTSPTQNKVVSSKVSRGNIYQGLQNKTNQNSPLPQNQNKLNKNGEIIRRALLEKNNNKNRNKKFFN